MVKTVLLIAGHGGRDRWNQGPTGYVEADGTLDIALAVGEALRKAGVNVVHDRTSDGDLAPKGVPYDKAADLRARVAVGDRSNADLQVDIHTDAQAAGIRGPMGIYTSFGRFSADSQRLADLVSRVVAEATGLPLRKLYTRPNSTKTDEYYATLRLAKNRRPACIIECAVHSDKQDEALLKNPTFRRKIGEAIAEAVLGFLWIDIATASAGTQAPAPTPDVFKIIVDGAHEIPGRLIDGQLWGPVRPLTENIGGTVASVDMDARVAFIEGGKA